MPNQPKPTVEQLAAENEALRARLDEAKETLRAMGDGAVSLSGDGTILYSNARFAEMAGISFKKIVGMSFHGMIAEQDRKRFTTMLAGGMKKAVHGELALQACDDTRIPVHLSIFPLSDSGGKAISVVVTDLTEVAAATAVRLRLALIVESSDDAIISVTLDGVVESWNRAAEMLYGYTAREAIGQPIESLIVPPEHFDEVKAELAAIRLGKPTRYTDTVRLHKNGTPVEVSVKASPMLDNTGKVVGASVNARDISARKRAEEERDRAMSQLQQFRDLLDDSNDSVFVVDSVTARIVDINKRACTSLGYPRDELLRMSVMEFGARMTDLAAWSDHVQRVKKTRTTLLEDEFRRKDGSNFPVEISVKHISLEGNDYIVAIARDITERQLAEQSLKRERDFNKRLVDVAPVIILTLDPQGRIVSFNRYMENLSGYSLSEVERKEWFDLFLPESIREPTRELFLRAIHDTETHGNITPLLTKDGEEKTIEWYDKTLKDVTGQTMGLIAIGLDVTDRIKDREALKESEQRFQLAMEGANDGLWDWNLLTDEVYYSPRWFSMLGYEADAFPPVLDTWSRLVYPDDKERALQRVQDYLEGRADDVEMEIRMKHRDGHDVIVLSRAIKVNRELDGKPVRLVGTHVDITQRKQAEESLRHLNRALKTLSSVNHTLVHAQDEEQLWQGVCRAAVEEGGYLLAWIGYAEENETKSVRVMASHAVKPGYTNGIRISWADVPEGRGPTGMAIRTGKSRYIQDIGHDPAMAPWQENALAYGYKACIALPLFENGKPFGVLTIYAAEPNAFNNKEVALLEEMAGDLGYGIHMLRTGIERDLSRVEQQHTLEQLSEGLEATVQAVATTVEMRDPYTAGHQRRVAILAVDIAREMGLPEEMIKGIHLAGTIHDLGKIRIPAEVLSKPGRLSDIEYQIIREHPQSGYEIMKGVKFPWPIADIILQHHERLDGSGYPQGLRGEQILLEAKIMAVADVVEAMSSHRPYRAGLGIDVALAEIEGNRGKTYEAKVVDACLKLFREKHYMLEGQPGPTPE